MTQAELDTHFMTLALAEARKAEAADEVPTACIIVLPKTTDAQPATPTVHDYRIIGRAHNQTQMLKDPTAHAEILAITQAAAHLGDWRLEHATLYVTKEPCAMCAGAIILARIPRIVWGLTDANRGGNSRFGILADANLNHRPQLAPGILEAECKEHFQNFFRTRRQQQ